MNTARIAAQATLRTLHRNKISKCQRHGRCDHRLQYSVLLYCSQQTYKQLISCHSSLTLASKWLVSIGLRLKNIFFLFRAKIHFSVGVLFLCFCMLHSINTCICYFAFVKTPSEVRETELDFLHKKFRSLLLSN